MWRTNVEGDEAAHQEENIDGDADQGEPPSGLAGRVGLTHNRQEDLWPKTQDVSCAFHACQSGRGVAAYASADDALDEAADVGKVVDARQQAEGERDYHGDDPHDHLHDRALDSLPVLDEVDAYHAHESENRSRSAHLTSHINDVECM